MEGVNQREKTAQTFRKLVGDTRYDQDKLKKLLHSELSGLSFHALFAGRYGLALTAAEEALQIDPTDLAPATNKAHALMYLGRPEEARSLYLEHKGKPVFANRVWDQEIVNDFQKFINAKQVHPMMSEVTKLLTPAASSVQPVPTWLVDALELSSQKISDAFAAGRYADAALLHEAHLALIEKSEISTTGKRGELTATELANYAFHAIFAKAFDKALAASDKALSLQPNAVWMMTNRAHALLFLGRADEAAAVYLSQKGKKIPEQDDRLWEAVVSEDFALFRKAGLDHPRLNAIESSSPRDDSSARWIEWVRGEADVFLTRGAQVQRRPSAEP